VLLVDKIQNFSVLAFFTVRKIPDSCLFAVHSAFNLVARMRNVYSAFLFRRFNALSGAASGLWGHSDLRLCFGTLSGTVHVNLEPSLIALGAGR